MKFSDLDIHAFGDTIQMAGAVFQGLGKTFLVFFPEDKNDHPLELLELDLEEWNRLIHQTDVLETEVLTQASDGKLAKVVLRKSQRQIETAVAWRVYKRDGYRCRYCGTDGALTVDHLVRWEEGGPSIEENLLSSCKKCNKVRGDKPYAEWLKHPRYLDLSRKLSAETRAANEALVPTLAGIPRVYHQRSR